GPTTIAARIAREAGKPYIVSPRGMLVQDLIARRSSLAKRTWIRVFERRNLTEAAAVHVTSALEEQEMRALGISPKRVFTIPNGVDFPAPPRDGSAQSADPDMLFLGRVSWKKGIDRLVSAMPL